MNNAKHFRDGLIDGIPIGLGYFAVAFSLGIFAKRVGLTAMQGFWASLLNLASAGEYALFSAMQDKVTYIELAIAILIVNARYFLMSFALSQRFSADTTLIHRLCVGYGITDEIFGISIARKGNVQPFYNYGAIAVAAPLWAIATAVGILAGTYLPVRIVSALSVALYGMFIAIIIPPCKRNRAVAICVTASFLLSAASTMLPLLKTLSSGTRTIILTVIISAVAAILFPISEEH
ncbi:MAG: AzlC family ABC transporter permease [Treponema sp.]|nr:AzlC family ABC transporter permease [Treponema sp.]